MDKSESSQEAILDTMAIFANKQAFTHERMKQSPAVRRHAAAVKKTTAAINSALESATFETLLQMEKLIQQLELERYSSHPKMMESIKQTQEDMAAGEADYRDLTETPDHYHKRGYRSRDRTGPNKEFPVDTMRKALRSQVVRLMNFVRNPMLIPEEEEYLRARIGMLRKAEKLYIALQRNSLATIDPATQTNE